MNNEILLILSVPLCYTAVLLAYRLFGKSGLYMMTATATILANIEVLILVEAFGLEQTLGNVMFAGTYLITDILSENEGKASASRAVWLGVFTSAAMLCFSQYWLLYTPSAEDWAMPHIAALFAITPRLLLGSFIGYTVSQRIDVWLYHRWWAYTTAKSGNSQSFLWLRNNGSTLLSQIINTVLFTGIAFGGIYDQSTLLAVMGSSYLIYIFTSLLDTPVVYLARYLKQKGHIPA